MIDFTIIGCILLTPFILIILTFLTLLAIITSTLTSSFIILRLTLLVIEMISGLTRESTHWMLSNLKTKLNNYLKQAEKKVNHNEGSIMMRRRKLNTSSLSLNKLPFKATIKSTYSLSVPGTPDTGSFFYE